MTYEIERPTYTSKEKKRHWDTAIGLNKVDALEPSEYFLSQAQKNISGELNNTEVYKNIKHYYETTPEAPQDERECDIVSVRIKEILENESFRFSPATLIGIHRFLFADIYPEWAGKVRDINIRKDEEVLGGKSVKYANYYEIHDNMAYDFEMERAYRYKMPLVKKDIEHLARFTSNIWQSHPFREGNTRTTAVFIEQYLKSMGITINNEPFAKDAKYFRDALVRSCYRNAEDDVMETFEYLEKFFSNLLLGTKYELKSHELDVKKYVSPKRR